MRPVSYTHLDVYKRQTYGTLPFAGVARAGFIAVQFVRAFVEIGIITQEEMDRFMNSMNTVNKKMARDWKDCQLGKMEKQEFLNKYGHIRPGTYDIMSPFLTAIPTLSQSGSVASSRSLFFAFAY